MSPYGEVLSGGTTTRYGYEGKEHDTIVGDTDFNFRKYKPEWGIFLQPDDIIQNIYDPQSLNRYMFERGNPYKYRDDDGHNPLLAMGIAAIVGAVIGVGYYMVTTPSEQYTLKEAGTAALAGAVGGAVAVGVATIAVGTAGLVTAGAISGTASQLTENLLSSERT